LLPGGPQPAFGRGVRPKLQKINALIIMFRMSKFDWTDLDPKLLGVLVAVVETGSITRAAVRLGVTQSAVSHLAAKLRGVVGDDLFVKAGRGIVATARAHRLAARARELLRELEHFAASEGFDPVRWRGLFVIAANDLQREALIPPLVARLRKHAPGVDLRIIPSNAPMPELLRDEHCHLIISPRPPQAADIIQKRLFEDEHRVFYDPAHRKPPKTRADYLAAEHVTVVYLPRRSIDIDERLAAAGLVRRFRVTVPGYSAIPSFLRGGDLVATAPSLLRFGPMQGLASAPSPIPLPKLPMFMIWSRRDHDDPAHRWMRGEIDVVARPVAARAR
jgi:DNA-binding transcriptional LysR family regulator